MKRKRMNRAAEPTDAHGGQPSGRFSFRKQIVDQVLLKSWSEKGRLSAVPGFSSVLYR